MRRPGAHRTTAGRRLDRERILRSLTFWLRPAFALRVVNRFHALAGFDRAVALASSALTALIPLALISSALLKRAGVSDLADRIIERYDLTGGGAEAVRDIFSPTVETTTSVGIAGALLLVVAVLSFSRAVQRMFEQAWELPPLSVRNTLNGLLWIAGLTLFLAVGAWVHDVAGRHRLDLVPTAIMLVPTGVFLLWTGRALTAARVDRRALVPFAVVGAVGGGLYGIGATVYVPHLFSTYATRYGVIGAVFAMISTLFCIMLILVVAAAVGREVADELARIRRGEHPPPDAVRREWDQLLADVRARWSGTTARLHRRRGRAAPPPG